MHSLGNDFVILDGISHSINIAQIPITKMAHRHTGIGFDQLLCVTKSSSADFACRIFNSDGSEAEQCGNGLRCVARFIQEKKLSDKNNLMIELKNNITKIEIVNSDNIKIEMPVPQFLPEYTISIDNTKLPMSIVSLGNPHAILSVSSLASIPFIEYGDRISTDPHFPSGINVGFMEIINPNHILLRTYERGSGPTLACGSNSCAAAVVGIRKKLLDSKVTVEMPLGHLQVEWKGENEPIILTGSAQKIFDGFYLPE